MPSDCKDFQCKGLAERRVSRIRERAHSKAALMRSHKIPRGERQEIRKMQLFFATLPHPELKAAYEAVTKAAYEAVTKALETRKQLNR